MFASKVAYHVMDHFSDKKKNNESCQVLHANTVASTTVKVSRIAVRFSKMFRKTYQPIFLENLFLLVCLPETTNF